MRRRLHRRRGLKPQQRRIRQPIPRRRLHRRRGLKLRACRDSSDLLLSPPSPAARIETPPALETGDDVPVAAFTGGAD